MLLQAKNHQDPISKEIYVNHQLRIELFVEDELVLTWILVSRVSIEDSPSGNRKGDGNPGGKAWPANDNLS